MAFSKRRQEMGEEKWAEWQKVRRVRKVVNYRKKAKKRLIAYKGGKCINCGYDKDVPAVYVFHHKDPAKKDFQISSGYSKGFNRMKKEVDKCVLLCRNCHAEIHNKEDYNPED